MNSPKTPGSSNKKPRIFLTMQNKETIIEKLKD